MQMGWRQQWGGRALEVQRQPRSLAPLPRAHLLQRLTLITLPDALSGREEWPEGEKSSADAGLHI